MGFDQSVKKHLASYRRDVLGVAESGTWNDMEYGHILPKCRCKLNIMEMIRSDFFDWVQQSEITLHPNFHHLNSSQAACFNLFFPPLQHLHRHNRVVLALLGLSDGDICKWEFEKVVNKKERTQFDLYLKLQSGAKIYVEFKYSENKLASAKNDESHRNKLHGVYKPKLKNKVAAEYLKDERKFFRNYQQLRNLSYFQPQRGDRVVFIYPKDNKRLNFLSDRLDAIVKKNIRKAVVVRHLEQAVADATKVLAADDDRLRNHFCQYLQKYLPFSGDKMPTV